MNKLNSVCMHAILLLFSSSGFLFAGENPSVRTKRAQEPYEIKAAAWGPTGQDVEAAKTRVGRSRELRTVLKGTNYRLIGFQFLENGSPDKSQPSLPPKRFQAVYYDYTNDRTIIAESDFAGREPILVTESDVQPGVGKEEIEAAFALVRSDAQFAAEFRAGSRELYEPMPPVSNLGGERLINVGVRDLSAGLEQIVGVSFKRGQIVRYENGAPPTARASADSCGMPNARQGSSPQGLSGQLQVTASQDGVTLWEMLVIRPSISSGKLGEGSGLEIRDVKYKGKSVLKRGHAPILNVKYINDACGPFRDWQYSEGFFDAPEEGSTEPAPGFRVLAPGQKATTAIESQNDTGNFQGVAVYQHFTSNGLELVLVTEMNAGWYRYIMEWRFAPDGTIRPRYGFDSVANPCVCLSHTHHVYWRFDFDVVQPNNKIFQIERGRRFMRQILTESKINRSYQTNRSFVVQNGSGDEAYQLTPGTGDGAADGYGKGDFWLVRFHGSADFPSELDDPSTEDMSANLDPWLTDESLDNQDVVVWYAGHSLHDESQTFADRRTNELVLGTYHVVGPDLRPIRW